MKRRAFLGAAAAVAAPLPAFAKGKPTLRVPSQHRTLAEAIAAAPETGGARIEIAPGTYREKLTLSKPDVDLVGLGKRPEDVVIVWGDAAKDSKGFGRSATLYVDADGFRATNLTLDNEYHRVHPEAPSQAHALFLNGDRAVIDRVRMLGAQDTFYAGSKKASAPARQYIRSSYIAGHVDFIFGNALAFFDRCHLHVIARSNAYITAHSRNAPEETSAYIFDHCTITTEGDGSYYFGRAWRPYAQVVFLDTRILGRIDPEGWREWTPGKTETWKTAAFTEYGSVGPNGSMRHRVFWSKKLTAAQAARWRLTAVFPDRSWIKPA